MKQLSVRLDAGAEARLCMLAERWHTTLGGAIRRAIEEAGEDTGDIATRLEAVASASQDVATRMEQVATRLEALASTPVTPAGKASHTPEPRTPVPGKASPPPQTPADTWDASRAVPKSRQLRDAGKR